MAEPTSFDLNAAGLDDGTLDFYALIQEPVDADAETLRAKISALYNEAQANRDHRNLTKRREYQTLLDLLPRARVVLLEPEKRARYDAYLASAKKGAAEVEFDVFMSDLLGLEETMEEKTGLLGVQDKPQVARARVLKVPEAAPSKAETKVKVPQLRPSVPVAALAAALIGFLLGAGAGWLGLGDAVPALLLGVIGAALGFFIVNRRPRTGIRS
ncbi:MAG: hypothetical protein KY445_03660 [Armatimonadetes bacterium]|nr:hypothetical protein [Armatimonadota bacterium]